MEYWTEKCPHCGFKSHMSSLSNKNGFGCVVVPCKNCGNPFIHPGRIELGVLTVKELRSFKARIAISLMWRHALLAVIPYALAQVLIPNPTWVSTAVGIVFLVLAILQSLRMTNKTILRELPLSNERLLHPGYRQILEDAKYKPHWDIL